jgi:hypothetical protein
VVSASPLPTRVNVYVDGFNFFYGCVKGTPYKWLDLAQLCAQLLPDAYIQRVRYFTALVDPSPVDPDQRLRQEEYLRALKTIPNLTIKLGYFLTRPNDMRRVHPLYGPDSKIPNPTNPKVPVWKTEEKGSDVNLATSLLLDAAAGDFDRAWVITNDADLAWPIELIRKTYRLQVGVFKPQRPANYPSRNFRPDSKPLIKAARWFRRIEEGHLAASQFPATMADAGGTIVKPPTW